MLYFTRSLGNSRSSQHVREGPPCHLRLSAADQNAVSTYDRIALASSLVVSPQALGRHFAGDTAHTKLP